MDYNNNQPLINSSQKKPKRSLAKIFAILTVVTALGCGAYFLIPYVFPTNQCLNKQDYLALTGEEYSDSINASEYFYDYAVTFQENSSVYTADSSAETSDTIGEIASFLKTRTHKSTVINLSIFNSNESADLAQQRVDTVKKEFIELGVDEDLIKSQIVGPSISDSTLSTENLSEDEDPNGLTITLTSTETCRQ